MRDAWPKKLLVLHTLKQKWDVIELPPHRPEHRRPLDMGGPRDQWLEAGPWDAY